MSKTRTNVICRQPIMNTMEKFVVQAAIIIATHHIIPFDLAVVDICDGRRLFSFLCIEWGIIADVDCDSEQYRFLGKTRRFVRYSRLKITKPNE
jgi:hypothetical protein